MTTTFDDPTDPDLEPYRRYVRQLFGTDTDAEPEQEPDPKPGNFVAREGNNPRPDTGDWDMREFTRQLFNQPD